VARVVQDLLTRLTRDTGVAVPAVVGRLPLLRDPEPTGVPVVFPVAGAEGVPAEPQACMARVVPAVQAWYMCTLGEGDLHVRTLGYLL